MIRGVLLLALLAAACSDGQKNPAGAAEPFRLRNAQFFSGALPGSAPLPQGTAFNDDDPARIILVSLSGSRVVTQGQGGKTISGNASTNAWSIGMAFQGLGSGWWSLPVGDLDSTTSPPTLSFSSAADFAQDVPVGPATIQVVALDQQGVAGPQSKLQFCVASSGPERASVCPGGTPAPSAAITLTWDAAVDLDLEVATPDGKVVTPRDPYVNDDDVGDVTKPHIDRDSNANCMDDGARRESLIWPASVKGSGEAPSGIYGIYVNLFSACAQQQVVHFKVQVTTTAPNDVGAAGAGDGSDTIEKVMFERAGELVPLQANPTDSKGLFVSEYDFG